MASAVTQDNRVVQRDQVQVAPRGVPFLRQEELVITVASHPFSGRDVGQVTRQQTLDLRNRTGRTQISATEVASPGEQVQVWIDEPWKNSPPVTSERLGVRGNERA